MSNFIKIFDNAVRTIRNDLTQKYNDEYARIKLETFDSDRQKEILKQISELEATIKSLKKEMDELDPVSSSDLRDTAEALGIDTMYYHHVSDVKTKIALHQTPVDTNRAEFDKIAKRFESMMQLAVGGKEQRNILLKFYTLDWKSLGIDIPYDLDLSNIEIKDGVISSDVKLLN